MLATSVTPALAQGYPGGGFGDRGYGRHHDRGIDAGTVIAGVAVIGVLAAIASAASNSSRSRNRGYNDRYRGNVKSEDQAVDACASRIEQRYGNGARISNVDNVYRTRDGYEGARHGRDA